MKKLLCTLSAILLICCMFTGCQKSKAKNKTDDESNLTSDNTSVPTEIDFSKTDEDMFTNRDFSTNYDENNSILIQLCDDCSTSSSNSVQISGNKITITEGATYIISGTLNDGMIIVNAPDTAKVQIVFNNVNINCNSSAALYIPEADKVFITLAEGTKNILSSGDAFTAIDENNIDAAIFSKQDLTINGSGSLTVNSPAGHGIVSKDDLVITGGNFNITSASHGLDANDSIRIANSSITMDTGKDGIHADNSKDASLGFVYISSGEINIKSQGDSISAGSYLQIESGTINATAGGGSENGTKTSSGSYGDFMGGGRPGSFFPTTPDNNENNISMKGIKAASCISIKDGIITIDSADDAIHSDASIIINGGIFEIAAGDDGIHADETLTVTAGVINITESYEGLEALHISIQGGDIKLVATDDGLNAAGGTDSDESAIGSGEGMFGGFGKDPGRGPGGGPDGNKGMSSTSNGSIVISGGTLYIKASGDGIDANGTLTITGGYIVVTGPIQGDTATLDYDVSSSITGGTFIGTGASNMAQTFSSSEQGVISVNVGNQSANTEITLKDKNGNIIISYAPELPFQIVILSSPSIISGETYIVTVGSVSGELTAS